MGIASLIIGIIALIISFIPIFGGIITTPAIIGIVLGSVFISKQSKEKGPKGLGIAGIILCSLAIVIVILYYVFFGFLIATSDFSEIGIFKNLSSRAVLNVGDTKKYNELEVKYIDLDSNYTDYVETRKVKEGYKIIKLVVEIKNEGEMSNYIADSNFSCYADDYVCENLYFESETGLNGFLNKGKKIRGNIFFEVPENAENITVEYVTYDYFPIGNKLIFIVK